MKFIAKMNDRYGSLEEYAKFKNPPPVQVEVDALNLQEAKAIARFLNYNYGLPGQEDMYEIEEKCPPDKATLDNWAKTEKPVTQEILKSIQKNGCTTPGCTHEHEFIFLNPRCHRGASTEVVFYKNDMYVSCAVCAQFIVRIQVLT